MGVANSKGCGACSMEICSAVAGDRPVGATMMSGLRHPLRARIDQQYLYDPLAVLPSNMGILCRASAEPGGGIIVKSIAKRSVSDALAAVRFELEQIKTFDHPNLCRVAEVHEDAERLYAVLEELSSDNILMLPTRVSELTEATIVGVVKKLLSAIAYLHDRGLPMLDLRPENILITENANGWPPPPQWNVKIIDFGLSARHSAAGAARLAESPYVAPEQIAQEPVDQRADLWSLGALTFELLSGSQAFASRDPKTRAASIRAGIWSFDPPQAWSGISDDAKGFVSSLMQRDPAKRLTPAQALQHAWLCSETKADPVLLSDQATKSLLRAATCSMMPRYLVMSLARSLSHGAISDLRKQIEAEDDALSGEVSFTELRRAFIRHSVPLSGQYVRLVGALDRGPEWQLSYRDLLAQATTFRQRVQEEVALSLFHKLGQDRLASSSLSGAIRKEAQLPNVLGDDTHRLVLEELVKPAELSFEDVSALLSRCGKQAQTAAQNTPQLVIPAVRTQRK